MTADAIAVRSNSFGGRRTRGRESAFRVTGSGIMNPSHLLRAFGVNDNEPLLALSEEEMVPPMRQLPRVVAFSLISIVLAFPKASIADPVSMRFKQGCAHVFLILQSEDQRILAVGEVLSVTHGATVTSRLTFRFRDGSLDDETTLFEQAGILRLLRDHHVQRGPSFPHPIDVLIDTKRAEVTMRDHGAGKDMTERLDLPDDVANGLLPEILQNIAWVTAETKVSYVAAGSKPRLVQLVIKPDGDERFSIAGSRHRAHRFKIEVKLGGLASIVAPILGKQPKNTHVWVADGEVPTFMKMEGSLYEGGPVWTVQQASAVWPSSAPR